MAKEKFMKDCYEDALSLFILLKILEPENLEYIYFSAIAAQELNLFEFSIKMHEIVCEKDPDFIGSKIFLISCYSKLGLTHKMEERYKELIALKDSIPEDSIYKAALCDIDNLIAMNKNSLHQ